MDTISKAVIPAAGKGTRLRPITDYLPKPMLPLAKKPVLQHIIEELREAGIEAIAVVIRSDHQDIISSFGGFGAIKWIIDDSASGPGGALLQAKEFIGKDDFVTIFADAPAKGAGRKDHLEQLLKIKQSRKIAAALSIYRIPGLEAGARGVVAVEEQKVAENTPVRITDLTEKPSVDTDQKYWASACRYVLDASIFSALKNIERDENAELQLTDAIRYLLKQGNRIAGLPLPTTMKRFDTGNFEGYFKAFSAFAK